MHRKETVYPDRAKLVQSLVCDSHGSAQCVVCEAEKDRGCHGDHVWQLYYTGFL